MNIRLLTLLIATATGVLAGWCFARRVQYCDTGVGGVLECWHYHRPYAAPWGFLAAAVTAVVLVVGLRRAARHR